MMGNDIERIIAGIDLIKDNTASAIENVSNNAAYKITTRGEHGEEEIENPASGFVASILGAMNSLIPDIEKMIVLKNGLYTSIETFNNSYGSPWTELIHLKSAVDKLPPADNLEYMGDRVRLLGLLNVALSRAIDARWAMIKYNDYIQRGYDYEYNGMKPTVITKRTLNRDTFGNIKQDYSENVNFKGGSIAPF